MIYIFIFVGNAKLDVKRRKHCLQIIYSEHSLMTSSLSNPQELIDTIKCFNSLNRHIEKVLSRSQGIKDSINIIIAEENETRLEITKASISASDGATSMHNLIANIKVLQQIRTKIDKMTNKCDPLFKSILESSRGFFE